MYLHRHNLAVHCPTDRPCPRLGAVAYLSCCLAVVVIGTVTVMTPPLCLGHGKRVPRRAEVAKVETSPFFPLLLYSPLSPLTYVREVSDDGYHVVIATKVCVNRTARHLVWKKVNGEALQLLVDVEWADLSSFYTDRSLRWLKEDAGNRGSDYSCLP